MSDAASGAKPSFEDAFAELEAVVTQMESGDLALDELVTLFERGQALERLCGTLLDEADLRIQQLRTDGSLAPLE